MMKRLLSVAILACAASAPVLAAVTWDEGVNGDLSNASASPTSLGVLAAGTSTVNGSIGTLFSSDPRDTFSFTVSGGYQLSALVFGNYSYGTYYDYTPISLYSGPMPSGSQLNFILLTSFGAGTDLLNFSSLHGPLAAGTYTLSLNSIQQDAAVDERSTYSIDFTVSPTAVPEPENYALILTGLALVGAAVRRRKAP